MNGETSFDVLYKMKNGGYERPIICKSGEDFRNLKAYLRDQAQGKPTCYIRLELAQ